MIAEVLDGRHVNGPKFVRWTMNDPPIGEPIIDDDVNELVPMVVSDHIIDAVTPRQLLRSTLCVTTRHNEDAQWILPFHLSNQLTCSRISSRRDGARIENDKLC